MAKKFVFLTDTLSNDFTCFRIVLDEFSSVICLLLCLFVFKMKSYAKAFANHVNEHDPGSSWYYAEPVLAWIPKKGIIDFIVAGVGASRDISIQEWAKSQTSSSNESGSGSNDNEKQTGRKKAQKKRAENDTPSESDDISHKKTTK